MSSFVVKVKAPVSYRMVFLARRSFSEGGSPSPPQATGARVSLVFFWGFQGFGKRHNSKFLPKFLFQNEIGIRSYFCQPIKNNKGIFFILIGLRT
jgi:hypothetical protein